MKKRFSIFTVIVFIFTMLFACENPANQQKDAEKENLSEVELSVSKAFSSVARVNAPTFSLTGASGGIYSRKTNTSTTITSPSGSVIYYTLDGSDPTNSQTRVTTSTNSVTIQLTSSGGKYSKGGYDIKAVAYSGGSYSDVVEERYTIGNNYSIPALAGSDVMLQAFNWMTSAPATAWYTTLYNNASAIKNFNWVWMPPPSDAASLQGYMPRQLYTFTNGYGTAAEQQAAINAIKGGTNNTKLIADIVINHRVGDTQVFDSFVNPVWNANQIVPQNVWGGPGSGWNDTGDQFPAARDIDLTDVLVQRDLLDYLSRLKELGYVGWRYDYVKGYTGQYNGFYNAISQAAFSVGELWEDNTPQDGLDDWVNETATGGAKSFVFDFSLKNTMNTVFGWYKKNPDGTYTNTPGTNNYSSLKRSDNTKQAGYVGWHPENSVTFIDNHDTGSTQMHWALEGDKVYQAYVYTLTQSGVPCVFWDHYFNWNDAINTQRIGNGKNMQQHIQELINIRRTAGVSYTSLVTTQTVNNNVYSAKVGDDLYMKIGSGSYSPPGSGWTVYSGNDFAVWYRASTTTTTTTSGGTTATLSITKDAGYGNGVFFAGNFVESNNWNTAIRGTWNSGNIWTCDVTLSSSSLEWKPLIMTYDSGASVTPIPGTATWRPGNNITTPNGGAW